METSVTVVLFKCEYCQASLEREQLKIGYDVVDEIEFINRR